MADRTVLRVDRKEELYLIASLVRDVPGAEVLAGYKRDIVTQQLSNIELQLLVCHFCSGFMRDACNTAGGAAMGCEICVGASSGSLSVGTVRTMVSNLKCVCPLKARGCVWGGCIGEVSIHLNDCVYLVVVCGYSVYGCPKRLRRGDIATHREESTLYHTELMSTFMTHKIDQLETANSVQGEAILELQHFVQGLRDSLESLRAQKEYMRPNGVLWRLTERDNLRQKMQACMPKEPARNQLGGYQQVQVIYNLVQNPQFPYPGALNTRKPAPSSFWSGNTLIGPNFELDSLQLRPQLVIESAERVSLQLVDATTTEVAEYPDYNHPFGMGTRPELYDDYEYEHSLQRRARPTTNVKTKERKWPLRGKCKVILVNPINRKADWLGEINTSQFTDKEPIKLTTIPFEVLLSDEFNSNGTIELQILFKTPYN